MSKILLVEDDALIRMSLAATLTTAGHECVEADNAFEARELLATSAFDLLLTDLYMPGDGLSVLRAADHLRPGTKKIIISGGIVIPRQLASSLGRRLGADALLLKPINPQELVRLVSRLTGTARYGESPCSARGGASYTPFRSEPENPSAI